jgi:hypothetical protein
VPKTAKTAPLQAFCHHAPPHFTAAKTPAAAPGALHPKNTLFFALFAVGWVVGWVVGWAKHYTRSAV